MKLPCGLSGAMAAKLSSRHYGYRMTCPEVRVLIGTAYPAANNLVARMGDAGILGEFTRRTRNRRFIA